MSGMVYALVLLGCADGAADCTPLAQPLSTFASRSACEAQVETALNSDLSLRADYPTVMAQCQPRTATIIAVQTRKPRQTRR